MNARTTQAVDRRPQFLPRESLQSLFSALMEAGYHIVGPVVRDGAIQFASMTSADALPVGVTNEQEPGRYRIGQDDSRRMFAWNHGPQGLKPLCFAPRETLWSEAREPMTFTQTLPAVEPTAVIGVRACDLAALAIQDRHFLHAVGADPHYRKRRESLLLIGVDCARSAATCFCVSTGDGPALDGGYDIGLAELDAGFLVWHQSEKGKAVTDRLSLTPASDDQLQAMLQATTQAAQAQQRSMPEKEALLGLYKRLEHTRWDEVAKRCLSCGNCTAVCPTCFCYQTDHQMALGGESSQMVREWDSCFSPTHSNMGHFLVRASTKHRYRQWLTHKLAGWQDQQGRTGCTGCGRCIAWCPVGIDLTEEATAILEEGSLDV